MTYSVIETRKIGNAERHTVLRKSLTKEMAERVRSCRAYANKVKGRDNRTVEVVEEHEGDRVRGVGRTVREGQTEIHAGLQGLHAAENADI